MSDAHIPPNTPDVTFGKHVFRPDAIKAANEFGIATEADAFIPAGPSLFANSERLVELEKELKEARLLLALTFGGPNLYRGLHGELLQDNSTQPTIDFGTDSMVTIHIKLKERQKKALNKK